jgi:hypothetical protein
MRLLAFSDIHHNLVAVRKLRACEKNDFDAVIVAGDIGNESAAEFFSILETFECPVMYVYGNWDNKLDYESCFGPRCHLIHSNVITVGELSFTGFSGCPTDWGKNPLARGVYRRIESQNKSVVDALKDGPKAAHKMQRTRAYQDYVSQLQQARDEILKRNTESIAHAVKTAGVDARRCVVVAHQRVPRLNDQLPDALLHVFGHLHTFSDRTFKMTRYVDVAALDRPVSARPRGKRKWNQEDCRNFNAGNYVTIEINSSYAVKVSCVDLPHDYPDWIPLEDRRYNGIAWIPEEIEWTNASDWPIPLRTTRIANPNAPA